MYKLHRWARMKLLSMQDELIYMESGEQGKRIVYDIKIPDIVSLFGNILVLNRGLYRKIGNINETCCGQESENW